MFYLILHLKEKVINFHVSGYTKRSGKVRTIKEVAQQANVSVATVSRVINKSGYVKKQHVKELNKSSKIRLLSNETARTLFTKNQKQLDCCYQI